MIGRWRRVPAGSVDKGDRIKWQGEELDVADIKVSSRVDGGGPSLLTFLLVTPDGRRRRWENFLADTKVSRGGGRSGR